MDPIAASVREFIAKIQHKQAPVLWIQEHWEELVGPVLAGHSAPVAVREKRLIVETDTPGEGYLITMRSRELFEQILKHSGMRIEQVQVRARR